MKAKVLAIFFFAIFAVSSCFEFDRGVDNNEFDNEANDVSEANEFVNRFGQLDKSDLFDVFEESNKGKVKPKQLCKRKSRNYYAKQRCFVPKCNHLCKLEGYENGNCSKLVKDKVKSCYCVKHATDCKKEHHAPAPRSPAHAPAPRSPARVPAPRRPAHAPAPRRPAHAPTPRPVHAPDFNGGVDVNKFDDEVADVNKTNEVVNRFDQLNESNLFDVSEELNKEKQKHKQLCQKKSRQYAGARCLESKCNHLCKLERYENGNCSKLEKDKVKKCYCVKHEKYCKKEYHVPAPRSPTHVPAPRNPAHAPAPIHIEHPY